MVLCWIFQREKNKLRTTHGTTDAVGVGAAARVAEKCTAIFLNLPCCPTKSGFRKVHFPAFYFNYMLNEPDTKQQSDCDSSAGVTAAVIRARLLGTPLPETLACSPLCFWVTCSFTFFLNHQEADSVSGCHSLSLTSNSSVVWQVAHTSSPLLSSQGLGWAVELQPWTHLIQRSSQPQCELGHWPFVFATASYFRCSVYNPQPLVCLASSP